MLNKIFKSTENLLCYLNFFQNNCFKWLNKAWSKNEPIFYLQRIKTFGSIGFEKITTVFRNKLLTKMNRGRPYWLTYEMWNFSMNTYLSFNQYPFKNILIMSHLNSPFFVFLWSLLLAYDFVIVREIKKSSINIKA